MTANMTLAPFSQEAEEAVIGSVLISPGVFESVQGMVTMGDFYLLRHRHLWAAFQVLSAQGMVMDLTTVAEQVRQMGMLDDIGGYAYLIHLINNTPNSMHAEAYAQLVQRTSTRRKLLMAADKIREAAMDETTPIDDVIAICETAVISAANAAQTLKPLLSMSDSVTDYKADVRASIQSHNENPLYVIGVRTGLSDLDTHLDGLREGITTVAGATAMGKSSCVVTIALNASQRGILRSREPRPAQTVLFSGEMTQKQLMNRLVSAKTGITVRNIERGNLTQEEMAHLGQALDDLEANHHLSFESIKRLNTAQIRQRVRNLVSYSELDLLILDGLLQIDDLKLDLNTSPRQRQYADAKRRDVIENVMNDLEDIGLTYKLPILLTHQVNRAPAARTNKRPQLSDLAEASFVEQKSAVILFLYREAYYEPETMNPDGAEVIVAKNRHGEPGTIHTFYNRKFTRFEDGDRVTWTLGE